ncbi:hypothetical protein Tco_1161674 [Tanacetum coccineum]
MKKYPSIPQIHKKDYHSIKDDTLLVSVYSTRNVLSRGMQIPNAFLTDEIHATDDYKEYETVFVGDEIEKMVEGKEDEESYASEFADSMLNDDVDDFGIRIEPESHKENPKVVADDDVSKMNDDEKDEDEVKDDDVAKMDVAAEEKDNDDCGKRTRRGVNTFSFKI